MIIMFNDITHFQMIFYFHIFPYRIPLVPRRPVTPDPNAAAAKAKDAKAKGKDAKGKESTGETPPPPADPDARLIFDAHLTGVGAIDRMVSCLKWFS